MTGSENQGDASAPRGGGTDSTESAPAAAPGEEQRTAETAPAGSEDANALDMTQFEADVEDSELSTALARVAELEDQLARAHAELYNQGQEYSNYVRRAKDAIPAHRESGQSEVIDALIGVLDDIDAARAHGDLDDGPFASIAAKLESTLQARFDLERYGAAGEDFDPAIHEALLANTSADVDHPVIAQILQPGYRRGERVLRAAKVVVDNPE